MVKILSCHRSWHTLNRRGCLCLRIPKDPPSIQWARNHWNLFYLSDLLFIWDNSIPVFNPRPVASIKRLWGPKRGGSEWLTLIPPLASVLRLKRTSWHMSDHYICLQYLFFFLSLIFRLSWLWRKRELSGISFAENFPNNCFRFSLSPLKSLATSTRVGASVPSLWTCNIIWWFSLESPVACWAQVRIPPP